MNKQLIKEIGKEFYAHNYQNCIKLCDEALTSEPLFYIPLCFKALCLSRFGKYEEAIRWFDKALKTELPIERLEQKYEKDGPVYTKPDFDIAIGNKGFCLLKLEKYEDAIICLDQALLINPQNYISLINKGFCLGELGKINEALTLYEKALVLQPITDKHYDFKGTLNDYYHLLKKVSESEKLKRIDQFYYSNEKDIVFLLWQNYLDDNKNNLITLVQRARAKFEQNDYFYSIDLLSICIKERPDFYTCWVFRADSYYALHDYESAANDYKKSIELEPTNGAAYDSCVRSLFRIGEVKEALKMIKIAVEIGKSPEPIIVMGHMLMSLGLKHEEFKTMSLGASMFPEDKRFDDYRN